MKVWMSHEELLYFAFQLHAASVNFEVDGNEEFETDHFLQNLGSSSRAHTRYPCSVFCDFFCKMRRLCGKENEKCILDDMPLMLEKCSVYFKIEVQSAYFPRYHTALEAEGDKRSKIKLCSAISWSR